MATYNAIKYNVDYGGFAGNLIPISTFTSDGSDANDTFNSSLITSAFEEYLFMKIVERIKMIKNVISKNIMLTLKIIQRK